MFKKTLLVLLTFIVSISFAGLSLAAENGNKRKGKYTYRKVYESCQKRGAVETAKPKLNPDAHSQAEWTKIFKDKKFADFGCAEEWSKLSEEQLRDIYSYLHDHASDSPTPAKCN
ncbi:MAG: cytochrome c family protein [Desulfobacteraceae bacterium A6]|nr:MAG: cytochrome c family protein [Desulfobacteraceae bacterium A6]